MYVYYSHHIKQTGHQPGLVVNPDLVIPCPRAGLKIWSRETGSAVPSRVSLLIRHTQDQAGCILTGFPPAFREKRHSPFVYTINRHRASPKIIRPRHCVPTACMTVESPPAQGQYSSQDSSSNACCAACSGR